MRGQRAIFQSLFGDDVEEISVVPERKGRSEDLLRKRNELIVCRHYYLTRIKELQYERALQKLESEQFLSQRTLIDIINTNGDLLKNINAQKPAAGYFRAKFPFMVW